MSHVLQSEPPPPTVYTLQTKRNTGPSYWVGIQMTSDRFDIPIIQNQRFRTTHIIGSQKVGEVQPVVSFLFSCFAVRTLSKFGE